MPAGEGVPQTCSGNRAKADFALRDDVAQGATPKTGMSLRLVSEPFMHICYTSQARF
jgi:hypothetical protein